MGHSAGCHLVALVATDQKVPRESTQITRHRQGCDRAGHPGVRPAKADCRNTVGALRPGVRQGPRRAPRRIAPAARRKGQEGIPPFLICYSSGMGRRPNPKRPVYANAFGDALRAAGVAAQVVDGSDRNHGEINQRFGDPQDQRVTGKAQKFLVRRSWARKIVRRPSAAKQSASGNFTHFLIPPLDGPFHFRSTTQRSFWLRCFISSTTMPKKMRQEM
jgi:acetyl esterase/lipase